MAFCSFFPVSKYYNMRPILRDLGGPYSVTRLVIWAIFQIYKYLFFIKTYKVILKIFFLFESLLMNNTYG